MITIDNNKCIGCGQCIEVCPFTVLELRDDGKATCTDKACLACMHCAAICPAQAIRYDDKSAIKESTDKMTENISNDLKILAKQRRSYRRFSKEKISREKITEILEIANWAPSAKNQHPVNWIVVDNTEVLDNIMNVILEFCKQTGRSPELISEYERGNNPVLGINSSVLIGYCMEDALNPACDTSIALTTVELLMQAEGIGTCWGGYLARYANEIPKCRKLIGLPEDATIYAALLFGHPDQNEYSKVPARLNPSKITFV